MTATTIGPSTSNAMTRQIRYFPISPVEMCDDRPGCLYGIAIGSLSAARSGACAGIVAIHDEAHVKQGKAEANGEDDERGSRAVAKGEALKTELVHVGRHGLAGVDRTAFGHDPDQIEELQRSNGRQKDRQADSRAEQWNSDIANDAQTRCAVELGRLLQVPRDALQSREIEDEVEADELPRDGDEQRIEHDVWIAEPPDRLVPRNNLAEELVEPRARVVEKAPHHASDDFRDDVRQKENRAKNRAATQMPANDESEAQGDGQLDEER